MGYPGYIKFSLLYTELLLVELLLAFPMIKFRAQFLNEEYLQLFFITLAKYFYSMYSCETELSRNLEKAVIYHYYSNRHCCHGNGSLAFPRLPVISPLRNTRVC